MSADDLGGLSLAEWEYAHRYRDFLELAEIEPDATGFDPLRIRIIRRILDSRWRDICRSIYESRRD